MAGNADDAVAVSVLEDVGLLVHVVHGIILGIGPEGHPVAVFLGRAGVAVVILVERQHHDAAAGHLDGVGVLHLGAVEVAVSGHQRGCGVGFGHALGHVQQAGQGAVLGVKIDAADGHGVARGVECLRREAGQQNDDQSDHKHNQSLVFAFLH